MAGGGGGGSGLGGAGSAAMSAATAAAAAAFTGGGAPTGNEKLVPFVPRRWEILSEPTPNVGENDTSLSLTLFDAIKNRTGRSAM